MRELIGYSLSAWTHVQDLTILRHAWFTSNGGVYQSMLVHIKSWIQVLFGRCCHLHLIIWTMNEYYVMLLCVNRIWYSSSSGKMSPQMISCFRWLTISELTWSVISDQLRIHYCEYHRSITDLSLTQKHLLD